MQKLRLASLAAGLLFAGSALAQTAPATITVAQARAVVDKEIDLVSKDYVINDERTGIVAALRANEAAGHYDLTNPAALADKLGGDAIASSHDKHMWVRYDPEQYAEMAGQENQRSAPTAKQIQAFMAQANRVNDGYKSLQILPGNVRYANVVNFAWDGKTPQAVTDAARFLSSGDAVIIDLRQNGGGSPNAVRALVSYFMPPDHRPLMRYHDGVSGKTETSYVTTKLGAPRMVGKPLYVLINGSTGSAAEEFAYHVKNFKLGTLVGQTTAGAANNNSMIPVAPGFIVSISTGRAIHPVTNTNWEGVGVPPDVVTPVGQALDKALLLALEKLAATPGPHAQDYAWGISGEKAKLSAPAQLNADAMAQYAGVYGERTILLQDGKLFYRRDGRAPLAMALVSDDLFTVGMGDALRLKFHRAGGKITSVDLMGDDGEVISNPRNP